jgi:2-keto-3-deoxy-L-rhamnonate aldolase RhmA
MIRDNWVKRRLASGKPTLGSWITIAHPTVAEVMAQAGFDWLVVDMEHGVIGVESVQTLIQAMSGTPTVPLVRVPWNDQVIIKQVLETGAQGLVIPQVRTAQEARDAVSACLYPPAGIRGIGCQRPAGFGAWFQEYLRGANAQILVVIQIEHIQAVKCLKEILAVKGIDAILIGSNDLSASMGLLGEPNDPKVLRVVDEIRATAQAAGVSPGIVASTPEDANKRISEGFRFVFIGQDVGLLSSACRDIAGRILWKDLERTGE